MEFLGDAVLRLVVANTLYTTHPHLRTEGTLTTALSSLTNGTFLAARARPLHLSAALLLSPGARAEGVHLTDNTLNDTLEAVIGAVYLDAGMEAATRVVHRAIGDFHTHLSGTDVDDPVTALQHWALARPQRELPVYREASRSGTAHAPVFTVHVGVAGAAETGRGAGPSLKTARREAARDMLAQQQQQQQDGLVVK